MTEGGGAGGRRYLGANNLIGTLTECDFLCEEEEEEEEDS
tara:strand:+ start:798 stop:917 length:120 start_codon:yes stop_codon:yes gene_type:complete